MKVQVINDKVFKKVEQKLLTCSVRYDKLNVFKEIEQKEGGKKLSYDYRKLSGRITEKFGTQSNFANAMGLSERSISLKLNNKVGFKQPEISKACSLLEIAREQINEYFFKENVQSN